MKIVIDIPQTAYDAIQTIKEIESTNNGTLENVLIKAVENGIPLDNLRAEIEQTVEHEMKEDKKWAIGLKYSLQIIDKYRKGEQE